ncbi:acyltransferase family protein [Siphonobacter aquaeclarae]|nr:acyltransferase [Siphonobacter aquaeclarae]
MLKNSHFLRFAAASAVIVGHAYVLNGFSDPIETASLGLFPTGQIAVYVFFVISGYTILQSRLQSADTGTFLLKRFLRIFPGLVGSLLFTILLVGSICTSYPLGRYLTMPETWFFWDNLKLFPHTTHVLPGVFQGNPSQGVNGSLWTLSYEILLYAFVACIVPFFRSRWYLFAGLFCAFFLSICLFNDAIARHEILRIVHLQPDQLVIFSTFFMLGMIFRIFREQIPLKGTWAIVAIVAWLGMYYPSSIRGWVPLITIHWVRFFCLSYLVIYAASIPGRLNDFGRFGDLSYGIYIYAYPVQQVIIQYFGATMPIPLQILLAFVLVLPLAWVSWHFVEKPALRYKSLLRADPGVRKEQSLPPESSFKSR